MKKVIYIAAGMLLFGSAATIASNSQANIAEARIECDWSDYATATAVRHGTVNEYGKWPVQFDSETGQYRIQFKGTWCIVRSSNKSGFDYMFNYQNKPHYFNL